MTTESRQQHDQFGTRNYGDPLDLWFMTHWHFSVLPCSHLFIQLRVRFLTFGFTSVLCVHMFVLWWTSELLVIIMTACLNFLLRSCIDNLMHSLFIYITVTMTTPGSTTTTTATTTTTEGTTPCCHDSEYITKAFFCCSYEGNIMRFVW